MILSVPNEVWLRIGDLSGHRPLLRLLLATSMTLSRAVVDTTDFLLPTLLARGEAAAIITIQSFWRRALLRTAHRVVAMLVDIASNELTHHEDPGRVLTIHQFRFDIIGATTPQRLEAAVQLCGMPSGSICAWRNVLDDTIVPIHPLTPTRAAWLNAKMLEIRTQRFDVPRDVAAAYRHHVAAEEWDNEHTLVITPSDL